MIARDWMLISLVALLPEGASGQGARSYPLQPANATIDQGFTQITSVRELHDGRLLISDRIENLLAVVDWTTGSVDPIARVGDGPGEYRAAGWLYAMEDDSTLLTDWRTRRWYLLDAARIVGAVPPDDRLRTLFDPILAGISTDGRVLGHIGSVFSSRSRTADSADSLLILLADRASGLIDTVAHVRGRGPPTTTPTNRGARIAQNPLAAEDLALLFPDGWIAVAYLEPYRIEWRRPDGSWIRGSPLPFEHASVTRGEKCAALQKRFNTLPQDCDHVSVPDWPAAIPAFLPISSITMSAPASPTLFAAPDGRLVLRRTPVASSPTNRYDLIDRSGELVGVLRLAANEAVVGFGAHAVYVIATDHNDLQWLRRHPWP